MDSTDAAVQKVTDGNAYAVIIFPENFTQNAYTAIKSPSISGNSVHSGAEITIRADESVANIKNAITGTVAEFHNHYNGK